MPCIYRSAIAVWLSSSILKIPPFHIPRDLWDVKDKRIEFGVDWCQIQQSRVIETEIHEKNLKKSSRSDVRNTFLDDLFK